MDTQTSLRGNNSNPWWGELDFTAFGEEQTVPSFEELKEKSFKENISSYESKSRKFFATGSIIVFGLAALACIIGVIAAFSTGDIVEVSDNIVGGAVYWFLVLVFGIPTFLLFYFVFPAILVSKDNGDSPFQYKARVKTLNPVVANMAANNNLKAELAAIFPDFVYIFAPAHAPQNIGPVLYSNSVGGPSVTVFNRSLGWYGKNESVGKLNVISIDLPRSFHHMSVTPKSLASYNLEEVPLPEGMEYFAGRAAVEAQSDFFYLFTPDVLALIQEEYDGMSFHVFRDKLYIVGQGHHDFDTVDGWLRIQSIVQSVGKEIVEQVKVTSSDASVFIPETYVDVQSGINAGDVAAAAGALAVGLATGVEMPLSTAPNENMESRKWKTNEKVLVILIFTVGLGLCWFLGLLVAPLFIR